MSHTQNSSPLLLPDSSASGTTSSRAHPNSRPWHPHGERVRSGYTFLLTTAVATLLASWGYFSLLSVRDGTLDSPDSTHPVESLSGAPSRRTQPPPLLSNNAGAPRGSESLGAHEAAEDDDEAPTERFPTLDEAIAEGNAATADTIQEDKSQTLQGTQIAYPCLLPNPEPMIVRPSAPAWAVLDSGFDRPHEGEVLQGIRMRNGDVLAALHSACEETSIVLIYESPRRVRMANGAPANSTSGTKQTLIRASRILRQLDEVLVFPSLDLPLRKYSTWLLDRALEKPPAPYPYQLGDEITRDPDHEVLAVHQEVDHASGKDRLQIEIRMSMQRSLDLRQAWTPPSAAPF